MKPIPRSLLPHTATLMVPGGTDVWQQPIYAHRQLLRVRVEPSDKMIAGSDNTQQQLVCTLFFDAQNSAPKGTEFSRRTENRVERPGNDGDARRRLYDGQRLHHWEVGLE